MSTFANAPGPGFSAQTMNDLQNELFSENDSLFNDTDEECISPKTNLSKTKTYNSELSKDQEEIKCIEFESKNSPCFMINIPILIYSF
jgi:hypothetical protein